MTRAAQHARENSSSVYINDDDNDGGGTRHQRRMASGIKFHNLKLNKLRKQHLSFTLTQIDAQDRKMCDDAQNSEAKRQRRDGEEDLGQHTRQRRFFVKLFPTTQLLLSCALLDFINRRLRAGEPGARGGGAAANGLQVFGLPARNARFGS